MSIRDLLKTSHRTEDPLPKDNGNNFCPININRDNADAFRMAIIVGNTPGTSLPLSDNKIKDINSLAMLTNLQNLSLNFNQITDMSELSV